MVPLQLFIMARPWFQKDHLLIPIMRWEKEGGRENGQIGSVGGSQLGKQSLGFSKVAMCHAAHGPVHTRLSLHKPVHIMNVYHGP